MATSSSPSSATSQMKYDVFISFRGKDTRYKFTDHLHAALGRRKIMTFVDDKLDRGDEISVALFDTIKASKLSVVIFSENYAGSRWCLSELEQILDCQRVRRQIVIPIFYHVDPSNVRHQDGAFGAAFSNLEKRLKKRLYDLEGLKAALVESADLSDWTIDDKTDILKKLNTLKHQDGTFEAEFAYKLEECLKKRLDELERLKADLDGWKSALKKAGNLSGWTVNDEMYENARIDEIVGHLLSKLNEMSPFDNLDLVGVESSIQVIESFLRIKSLDDVHIVGIWGIGGIGKTSIGRAVFNKISKQFESSYFAGNVREKSENSSDLMYLKEEVFYAILDDRHANIELSYTKERLKRKKVLLAFDDVTSFEQIKKLIGDFENLGPESRIIITTRDKQVLRNCGVDDSNTFEVTGLSYDKAFQLFRRFAFRKNYPIVHDEELHKKIISYAKGVPLALKVLGSFLCGKTKQEWESEMEKLKKYPPDEIQSVLRISYDGLGYEDKSIFLDIACFFKGRRTHDVEDILNACNFSTKSGLRNLVDKSLISISYDIIDMHDLLQEMGREVVRTECDEPGGRSRLWHPEDISRVLRYNEGTKNVQGIMCREELNLEANAKSFSEMKNLRLLKIRGVKLEKGIECLSNNLRLLEWPGYPLKSLPPNLQLDKIVELDLSYSNIEKLWDGNQSLEGLKSINLRNCSNLTSIPDCITGAPNLEMLDLEGCTKLREIHSSLLVLNKITHFCMRNCTNLTTFPRKVCMESLQSLDLSGCSKLASEAEEISEELDITGTAIKQPESNIFMKTIRKLFPRFWRSSNSTGFKLPSFSGCRSLKKLNLRGCNIGEGGIPSDIGELKNLSMLDLSNNSFVSLPESISRLSHLERLFLVNCKKLQSLPVLPNFTEILNVSGCVSLESSSDALRLTTWDSHQKHIFAVNCPNFLCSNIMSTVFSMLKDNMQHFVLRMESRMRIFGEAKGTSGFQITVPGNFISEWFQQKEGCLITLKRHPYYYKKSKLIGYVACCVFVVHKHPPIITRTGDWTHRLRFRYSALCFPYCTFEENSGQVMSEHTWLVFVDARHGTRAKFSFGIDYGPGLEIKRCGARPIYEQDIADQFNQSSGLNAWNLNKFPCEAFAGSTIREEDESIEDDEYLIEEDDESVKEDKSIEEEDDESIEEDDESIEEDKSIEEEEDESIEEGDESIEEYKSIEEEEDESIEGGDESIEEYKSIEQEDDESEYCRCFSVDEQKKEAAISYFDAHPSRFARNLVRHWLMSSLGVLVHIYTISESNYDAAESSPFCCSNISDEDYIANMNFLDILVPELKDYIRSIMGVNTSVGSRPDSDEGQSSGSGNGDGEAQPKRLKLKIGLDLEIPWWRFSLQCLYISFKGSKQDLESIQNEDSLLKIACQTKIDIVVDERLSCELFTKN